jgi:hypothetical protein
MLACVVGYFDSVADTGGGGWMRRSMIDEGRRRGHVVEELSVYPRLHLRPSAAPDIHILADVWNIPWHWQPRGLRGRVRSLLPRSPLRQYRRLVRDIVRSRRYVHVDNAYVDVCDLPYIPCNGMVDGMRCPFKTRPGARSCFRARTAEMFARSQLNVFASPLHQGVHQRLLGDKLDPQRLFAIRPIMETQMWAPPSDPPPQRDIPLLFAGVFNEAKGSDEINRLWPEGEVRVVGPPTAEALAYPGYVGHSAHGDMPAVLHRAQRFVHHPRWPEPLPFAVLEAALAGCDLDTNDNVGAVSFGADLGDPSFYEGAAAEFWEKVEGIAARV